MSTYKMLVNEKILIYGGSGSLGNEIIQRYISKNTIVNFSRDENKHWAMELKYKSPNLSNIIGDIRDENKVKNSLIRVNPTIIIIASALKHINKCEYEGHECVETNIIGVRNVLDNIESHLDQLTILKYVCFISTDKACSPVNVYGMCKSICEASMVEKSKYIKRVKFVTVRYGNVLNSRGSIIPILENKCKDEETKELTLTSEKMTRFVITLKEAVDLIEYSMLKADNGDICVPKLKSMKIKDLFELFSEKYDKPVIVTGLRSGEKIHEILLNGVQSMRTVERGIYYHIKPTYKDFCDESKSEDEYSSKTEQLNKEELLHFIKSIGLF
jgi:FlaA1/EpsC-like NDP-sugar epimerase